MRQLAALLVVFMVGCSAEHAEKRPTSSDAGNNQAGASGTQGGSGAASGASGNAGAGAASGNAGAGAASSADGGTCTDSCPAPRGSVEWQCKRRFMYGVNYAWLTFGGDFGGIPQWSQRGVVGETSAHSTKLADMRARGVSVVRWWVFPDFRGAGVTFDGTDSPTGLSTGALSDLSKALELAAQHDLYLMPCLFSFDGFRPTGDEAGIRVRGLAPIALDATKRAALMSKVVRPFARAVETSAHRGRVIAWDVINEPEWAISGPSLDKDPYAPNPDLQPLSHAQMETFIADTIVALRGESKAMVTVGAAAMKWARSWSKLDLDFYQFHIYDWVNPYWPYSKSPAEYGVGDKPVVMGEFPLRGLTSVSYADMLKSWYENGYAGALGWQYIEAQPADLEAVRAFAAQHACETRY